MQKIKNFLTKLIKCLSNKRDEKIKSYTLNKKEYLDNLLSEIEKEINIKRCLILQTKGLKSL